MSVAEDQPGVSTLVGTSKQIQDRLRNCGADQVLVLSFERVDNHLRSVIAK
ncbi:hypothetical protein [Burkholderia glumae]|uniref:hypothetical protein n=1 Tax=Burkholderia glumae TaxID=337 RepID=UPI0002DE6953|nr:hypothetical protein [Burkholderia glumae]MCM2494896.1 hypothetical protein [Burkholderia glumae]MCM2545762.1 hypothetical protein [Burkholderia glumae]